MIDDKCEGFYNSIILSLVSDDEICAVVAKRPHNYLLPHPFDCTKFYICQNLGHKTRWRGGWKAHLMDCPPKTGFAIKLMVCNWLKHLRRCLRSKQLVDPYDLNLVYSK